MFGETKPITISINDGDSEVTVTLPGQQLRDDLILTFIKMLPPLGYVVSESDIEEIEIALGLAVRDNPNEY